MKNILCILVLSFAAASSYGAVYEFQNRNLDQDYFGPDTWRTGDGVTNLPPASGDAVYVTSGTGYDTTVTVTNDVSVDYNYLVFKAQPSSSFKFLTAGDAHTFEMPYSDGAAYAANALYMHDGGGNAFATISRAVSSNPVFSWTDPMFTLSSAANSSARLVVERGTFDFLTPGGYDLSANTFTLSRTSEMLFGTNVVVKFPKVTIDSGSARLLFRGASVKQGNKFYPQYGYVEFNDGTTASLGVVEIKAAKGFLVDGESSVTVTQNFTVAASTCPTVTVHNATLHVKGSMWVGTSTDAKLIIEDGGSVIVDGGDNILVANGAGNGGVEVRGGSLTTGRIRLSRAGAAADKTAYLLQTGGTITFNGSGIQFQQSCTSDNKGTHYVQLDGGVMKAKSIFRDATVTAGTVYLSGNGGTYQAYAAGTLAERLAYAECGEKGLTVDTAGYNCTFAVPVQDKSGANGLFVKKGTGTLTMSQPSDYTVSRTVAAGGTLKFSGDLDAHTDLVVTNGAALSLAGAAASAVVDSLVVTNGVLELDPGDVVTVNGAFYVKGLRIRWTSLPATEQTVLVCQGALSDDMKRELRKTLYDNAVPAGEHAAITFEYDDATHTTSIRASVAADEPLADEATWTGSGSWAQAANWENAVKPDGTKVAVFGAGASGQNVTVADGDIAGALSFTGGAYSLSGADALRIDGDPGAARIDVAAGSHVVSVPLDVLFSLPVEVASGAQLSLDGVVNAGSLSKTGLGRLVLGGTLDTLQGFSTAEGFTTVTNATAFGAAATAPAKILAGTLEFRHPAGEEMTIAAPVVMYATNNRERVVFKTDTDVTMTDFAGTQGAFYKRGAGTLTIDVPANTTYKLTSNVGGSPQSSDMTTVVFPADGSAPTGGYAPCCLVEGGVKVVGHGSSRMECSGGIILGAPTTSSSAQASLTIDKTYFISWGGFYPGHMATVANNNTHPVLRVLNGGTFYVTSGVMPGYACTSDKDLVTFALTNGTYRLGTVDTYLTRGQIAGSPSTYIIVRYLMNDSNLYINESVKVGGSILIDADNGSFVGGVGRVPITFNWAEQDRTYGQIRVRNGSTLALGAINEVSSQNRDLTFVFDDGEWMYDSACGDKTWPASTTGHTLYEMRGKGVILKPSAGHTFTTLAPFTGTGGVVNAGKGTVAFASGTAQFGGTVEVTDADGVVDFSANGAALSGNGFKGNGTIVGASVNGATFHVDLGGESAEGVPTLHNCTLTGRVLVDAGRTAENPLVPGPLAEPVAIAKISGTTTFSPSQCRLVNTGMKNLGGEFRLIGDTIYLQAIVGTGAVIIVL